MCASAKELARSSEGVTLISVMEAPKVMNLWGGKVVGGKARAGEVAGRAVLFVPLDGVWELHDLAWDRPDEDCTDSCWEDDAKTLATVDGWDIDWIDSSQLREFIARHFGGLEAEAVARSFAESL